MATRLHAVPGAIEAPESDHAAAGESALREPDPHAVSRYSFLEHATRVVLLEQLAAAGGPDGDADMARKAFGSWEDLQRAGQQRAIADLWRKVGRFLVGLGVAPDGGYGEATWRRLYLTEVAPWTDYAEGDEYRYLGLTGPIGAV